MIAINDYQNILRECYCSKSDYKMLIVPTENLSVMKNENIDTLADCSLNI